MLKRSNSKKKYCTWLLVIKNFVMFYESMYIILKIGNALRMISKIGSNIETISTWNSLLRSWVSQEERIWYE